MGNITLLRDTTHSRTIHEPFSNHFKKMSKLVQDIAEKFSVRTLLKKILNVWSKKRVKNWWNNVVHNLLNLQCTWYIITWKCSYIICSVYTTKKKVGNRIMRNQMFVVCWHHCHIGNGIIFQSFFFQVCAKFPNQVWRKICINVRCGKPNS